MKKAIAISTPVRHALSVMGKTIAVARKRKGVSQTELATRMGVTPVTVARIEKGHPGSSLGTVFKALWLLDMPLWPSLNVEVSAEIRQLQAKEELMVQRVGRRKVHDDF